MRNHPKGFTTSIAMAIVFLFSLPFLVNIIIHQQAKDDIYHMADEVPEKEVALVLGAAAWGSTLSPILEDRVDVAIELYESGKVEQVIMSGAKNETGTMKYYAAQQGVDFDDILEDPEGLSTLASIENLDPEKSVIIVSQTYHLPRALFMAKQFGLDAVGMSSTFQEYEKINQFKRREFLAIFWTAFDFWLLRS